ncbi:MAG TPA: penicillin acylase family protein [Blastocatellia bacterium]|nr:penicillin acylase family protein [Blastocatellia bacterium]
MKRAALLFALLCFSSFAQAQSNDLKMRAQSVLAQITGTINVRGLQKPVRVLRDEWGIAHIYAETQDDLFFAQGFVAAQDRLWQLDIWRRTGEGKLAEILGKDYIERDKFARLLRYRGDMKAEYESYAPDAKQIITAFVRGINAYIEANRARLPIEFQLTGIKPDLWTPEVCLTRMAGYVMTRNASTEVLRAQLIKAVGKDLVEELIETDPPTKLTIPEGLNLDDISDQILRAASAASGSVNFRQIEGSNNWVVDGTMSATGKPLLANDPHRPINLPSLRYLVHLVGPGWNVIGAGEPALPGVAAGHNERMGFGFTIVGIDQQDLYVEEVNPANPNEYKFKGKWLKMRIERETINVKGQAPVTVELKFTNHGPVIYEDVNKHRAYALRWVGQEPGTAGYLASLSLNRAQNWQQFYKALSRWKVPSENLMYADVDGNIGWVAAGLTPIRKGWNGLLPVPGASGKYEWSGFRSVKEMPQAYNPAKHYIATANHNIMPPGYKTPLGYEWAAPFRFHRIDEVIANFKGKFTISDFQKLQHDETSLPARQLTKVLQEVTHVPSDLQPFVTMLTNWDCVMSKDSAAAALFAMWNNKLSAAVFKSHVPEKHWQQFASRISLEKTIEALRYASPKWFGDSSRAVRDRALLMALDQAVAEAKQRLGIDPAKWRWGTLHKAQFNHALSSNDELRALFDLPAPERGGDGNTPNATGGANYRQSAGASFREILDVSNWDSSVGTNVPGQSGQVGSPHYNDLLPLWANGQYFPLLFSREKIEANAKNKLVLEPLK